MKQGVRSQKSVFICANLWLRTWRTWRLGGWHERRNQEQVANFPGRQGVTHQEQIRRPVFAEVLNMPISRTDPFPFRFTFQSEPTRFQLNYNLNSELLVSTSYS